MSSDYDRIREENISEYGKGTRHLAFFDRLYSDRTHFIFELLQNAEDAEATKVRFDLFQDRLVVKHDGRLFNEKDVRGVCGVGESTKTYDFTQIGKFGIGFKSVYAFTQTPEIHCGEEHFKIENYVRPFAVEEKINLGNLWTTLFILPFNHPDISASNAFDEIGNKLKSLNVYTLLFLRNIEKISWYIENESEGIYSREVENYEQSRRVKLLGQDGSEVEEDWLVFERPIQIPEKNKSVYVEVGFKIAEDKEGKKRIEKISESPLIVFFPTDKPTHLGFLIQGPYRTTPARDNIPKNDEWNKRLIEETATLMLESLFKIKELGFLNVSCLETMPIRSEDFLEGSMFRPIFDSVSKAIRESELLPADNDTFVAAKNAKIARSSELRKLLNHKQLSQLILHESEIKWLSGEITQDRTPQLKAYLMNELEVEEITPDSFARKISKSFLSKQSDEWMISFYSFVGSQKALWKEGSDSYRNPAVPLRNKRFIRLQDNAHVEPFRNDGTPNVYLSLGLCTKKDLRVVKAEIAKDKQVIQFLKELGISELDIVAEVLEIILPKYDADSISPSEEEHLKDMETILKAYSIDSNEKKERLKNKLKTTSFIYVNNHALKISVYRKPSEAYFFSHELEIYFRDNKDAWFVCTLYDDSIKSMLKDLGVSDSIKIQSKSGQYSTQDVHLDYIRGYRRGIRGFDPDIEVDGIQHALSNPDFNFEISLIIWDIAKKFIHCIRGEVLRSSRQNFSPDASTYEKEKQLSKFGKLLIENEWLPNRQGTFHKPSELTLSDLSDEFEPESIESRKLAEILGLKKNTEQELLAQLPEDKRRRYELAEQIPLEKLEELKKSLEKPAFPHKSVSNPERRSKKIEEQAQSAIPKESEKRERTVRVSENEARESAKTYLQVLYTNDDDQMICQICKNEMPFKLSDGNYYFETVQCIPNVDNEFEQNYLALCPVCAAKYHHARKTGDEIIKEAIVKSNDMEISVDLADKTETIQFVEQHFHDLKIVLEVEGEKHEKKE